jgi:hypothetical protein
MSLEPGSDHPPANPGPAGAVARARTIRQLRELIAALDRRVPQVHRAGELAIARIAAELRARAMNRIDALERETAPGDNA